ncbi:MAG: hypothetical protein FJ041_04875 [Candidatus Cloacimonetes bacterium]|nr:hypothetical protein [Candidatus Cloacimonadota bacterium]
MISVLITDDLIKLNREIVHAFSYIFETLGFSYRFVKDTSFLRQNDILVLYGTDEPKPEDLEALAKKHITIFIKAFPKLYEPNGFNTMQLRRMLRDVKLFTQTPIIVEYKFDFPAENYMTTDAIACKVNFDLPGNVYYHLANLEEYCETARDVQNCLPEASSAFYQWKDYPFVDNFLWLIDNIIKEQVKARKQYIVQKHYWPNAEDIAIALSHSVEELQKWDYNGIFLSVIDDIILFFTLRWQHLFRNIWSKLKYIFTNFEIYWNFQEFMALEKENNIRSTWFIAPESTPDIDYTLDDTDLQDEMRTIQRNGNDIGLLATDDTLERDKFVNRKHIMIRQLQKERIGIRQYNYRLHEKTRDLHQRLVPLYDSSLSFRNAVGFKNGMVFPFKPIVSALLSNHPELPVCFRDNVLKLSKFNLVSFDDAKQMVKKLFQSVRRSKGLFVCDFTVANYSDIPYCYKLYSYLIALIKAERAWTATLSDITKWWEQRACITIEESEFDFSIIFTKAMPGFAVQFFGEINILSVEDVESRIEGNTIYFSNIQPGSIADVRFEHRNNICGNQI